MQFYSTSNHSHKVSLKEAMSHSEAIDGGIYMPEKLPCFPQAFFNNISEMSPQEISYFVANNLFNPDIPSPVIKDIGDDTFNFHIPLVEIEPGISALELFHGPTNNVKDIALRFCARAIAAMNPTINKTINVLVATNGNSGNAVASGFLNLKGVNVFVLYPRTAPLSRIEPIRNLGGNIHSIAVDGNIEDCREIVSQALADKKFNEEYLFTSANSINIGRILPQTICFFAAYSMLERKVGKLGNVVVSVPCGNCGDLLAGYFSILMGLPISKLVAACNGNGTFAKFLVDGRMDMPMVSQESLSYALDCSRPSNLRRFYDVCNGDLSKLREKITATTCQDEQIKSIIKDVYNRTGYVMDPHTAVAYKGLKETMKPGDNGIIFATAHPCKAAELLYELIGVEFSAPVGASCSYRARGKEKLLPPTYPAFKKYLTNILKTL